MLNEVKARLREMTRPGDRVVCAVSGGADSMALLWAVYLLREPLGIRLEAAHFNHGLRGGESLRDENFVREFCRRYDIPLTVGAGTVTAGKKGLEAAAREARYAFLHTRPGWIATAHTADDNAETVLLHLVRGTGLKGLGAIAPVNGRLIRPMLGVTRRQVTAFLEEYHIPHIDDSSNDTDAFLRNRLRHSVMPLLTAENPKLAKNLSAMALRLRQDEEALSDLARFDTLPDVQTLRTLPSAVRGRMLERFLKENGVREPEAQHITLAERLIFSEKPSASARFPGGVTIRRNYHRMEALPPEAPLSSVTLLLPGTAELPELGLRVIAEPAEEIVQTPLTFTVAPVGAVVVRCRQAGDEIRLSGGTKSVKKLFIDRKIPADRRLRIPVLADDAGVLGICGIGVNLDRVPQAPPGIQIRFEIMQP
ncbi:MAG: tRNA lysidine(34) synthetase TilS [Firmicutes bacterium]|nr:tRNA lysidine(34) synthetase TilS [Bacillota bacterium]